MLNIIEEKLDLSSELNKKIEQAKNYSSVSITVKKGRLIKLESTNIAYVYPHKVIINNYTFLFFNGTDIFYLNSLNEQHHISQLEEYFRIAKVI